MIEIRTHVDNNGRILIPAQIRKHFNIKNGDVFVMRAVDGEIKVVSLDKAVSDAQKLIKQFVPQKISMVDELINMRREEFYREENKR